MSLGRPGTIVPGFLYESPPRLTCPSHALKEQKLSITLGFWMYVLCSRRNVMSILALFHPYAR